MQGDVLKTGLLFQCLADDNQTSFFASLGMDARQQNDNKKSRIGKEASGENGAFF